MGTEPGKGVDLVRPLSYVLLVYGVVIGALMFWWDYEPPRFDVVKFTRQQVQPGHELATGEVVTAALIGVMNTVLNKRGGYLNNDMFPPGVLMDNVPYWEFGVITQCRDLVRAMRDDFSRSQTQSIEDKDLATAAPKFQYDTLSWMLPRTEGEYQDGIDALRSFLDRLSDNDTQDAQIYSRSDNLREWLAVVEKRLGSLSQRLSASVGQARLNTDLQGDVAATQSKEQSGIVVVKTPWLEIDDVFYEARGSTWALIHFMKAIEVDFHPVLVNKNADVSLKQIIRELEASQETVWSPMILNGTGFGFMANHSLVMASYISRAHAAVIDLRELLEKG